MSYIILMKKRMGDFSSQPGVFFSPLGIFAVETFQPFGDVLVAQQRALTGGGLRSCGFGLELELKILEIAWNIEMLVVRCSFSFQFIDCSF